MCSSPKNISEKIGVKRKIKKIPVKVSSLLKFSFSRMFEIKIKIKIEKIIFKISGEYSFTPKMKYVPESKSVQSGEDEDEVNPYFVIPHTPCFAKFLAIDM